MKTLVFILSFCLLSTFAHAVSVEQIAKLAELQTKDELILQMVQREGLDRPLTMDDVIMLREKGVSERVIDYLLKLSSPTNAASQKQEGESVWLDKNLRAYHSRDKKGKPILVVTNLDEKGKRMGPPPPPTPEEVYVPEEQPKPVQEVHVTVTHEQPEPPPYDDEYPEEPPSPYYDSYYPGGGYYPGGYYPYDPGLYPPSNPNFDRRNFPAGKFDRVRTQRPTGGGFHPRPTSPAPKSGSAMKSSRAGMGFRPR
ncbi:multiubiquitin domain-containing protein [bacterium]|nr:multiubiquitin domain-containing protein [bacterium]